MSLFRNSSFRLKKREKTHRPPPLDKMTENTTKESEEEAGVGRESIDVQAGQTLLTVPDSARTAFFTLPSGVGSRSSLFGRAVSGSQEDKPRTSFFKLPNLSRSSFVSTLRREKESRGRNPFDGVQGLDDTSGSFRHVSADLSGSGYIPTSKRPQSSYSSMTNLLAGLDVIDIAAPPNSNVRQRSRTLSTKSAPDTPDIHPRNALLHLFTDHPPSPSAHSRSSLDTPQKRKAQVTMPPRLSLDMPGATSLLAVMLPSPSRRFDEVSDDLTVMPNIPLRSPVPTIVSATSASTVQDSLMGSYDVSSSESDPDQSFTPGEDDCGPIDVSEPCVGDESIFSRSGQPGDDSLSEITPPRAIVTGLGRRASVKPSIRPLAMHFAFPGPPALPEVFQTPFRDPLESYFDLHDTPYSSLEMLPSDTSMFEIRPKPVPEALPKTPIRRFSVNSFRAGNTPPARQLRFRKPLPSVTVDGMCSRVEGTLEEPRTPQTPQTPSFLVGLAWPRPPMRQIYVDIQKPEASWHTVSSAAGELLIDETGTVTVDPCHVIMLAQAMDKLAQPLTHASMRERYRLPPSAIPVLAKLALQNQRPISA